MRSAVVIVALAWAGTAEAQMPPMDMSGMMANQMQLQQMGDQMARQAAQNYYNQIQQYRAATGYTGYIPPPVSSQQLQQSINGANQATQNYIAGSQANSDRQSAAVERYSQQAILGQQNMVNPETGQVYSNVPNSYNNYFVTPQGNVYGTNSSNLPPGVTQLQPQW